MAFEVARVATELEARGVERDSAAIDAVRSGRCSPENAMEAIRRYDEKLARGEDVTHRLLSRWVIDGGFEPQAAKPTIDRRLYDEERVWVERHLPDLAPSIAASALSMVRARSNREPSADEVRAHAIANAKRTYGDDWEDLVLRASYSPADHDRWDAEAEALRERRHDLFPGPSSTARPRRRRRAGAAATQPGGRA